MNDVQLAIRLTADADAATRAMDDVGDAATRMAADVDAATSKADAATSRMDSVADSADEMASKSSQAAGGIGDLGGALSLMPGPLGAVGAGMEAVAPAIMGVTGAADLLNLVTKANIVTQTRAKIAAVATAVATRTQAAATRTAAIAQRILNAAMRANPIGLVITALLIVAGLFVLAYKRSERFRAVVNAVMGAVRGFIMRVVGVIQTLIGWVADRLPGAWNAARDAIARVLSGIRDAFGSAWGWIRDKVADVVNGIRELVQRIADKVHDVADAIREAFRAAWDAVLGFIQPVIDKVEWVIDKLNDIKNVDIPFVGRVAPGASLSTGGGGDVSSSGSSTAPTVVYHIDVSGVLDAAAAGDTIVRVLNERERRLGRRASYA